jgi:hypothetical protein
MSKTFLYIIGGAFVYYLATKYEKANKNKKKTLANRQKNPREGNAFDLFGFVGGETYLRDDIEKDRTKFSDSNTSEESLWEEWGVRLGDPDRYELTKRTTEISKTLHDYPTVSRAAPPAFEPDYYQF